MAYLKDGGRDIVGDGDRMESNGEGHSTTKRSILDCLLANSSAPFPLSSERVCWGIGGGFRLISGDFRLEDQLGIVLTWSALSAALGDLFWKFEASAPRANGSSSVDTSPCPLCFRLSSAVCTIERRSGLGVNFGFSINVNIDFLGPLRAPIVSRIPVFGCGVSLISPWLITCCTGVIGAGSIGYKAE